MEETDKLVVFDAAAREKLLAGVNTLADAVRVTMGPRGRNVLIEQRGQHPIVTKDGVTVAKSINLRDKLQNLGAQMIKEAASRSADEAGDGTTTATVLTQAIFSEGLKLVLSGFPATDLKSGIDQAVDEIISRIDDIAVPARSPEVLRRVAVISANGEESLGELIESAIRTVGEDGVVTVEEAKGYSSSLTVVDGTRIDRGYTSPYFVTDQDRMVCEMDRPAVLLLNRRVDSIKDIVGLLEKSLAAKRPLLIVADDIDGEAMQTLVLNRVRGSLNVCAIRAPGAGAGRYDQMQDLAVLLSTRVYSAADTDELSKLQLTDLGTCTRALIGRTETVLVGANADRDRVVERLEEIRKQYAEATEEGERLQTKQRLARLSGGVAILRVGGATEAELKERKDRADDALHAVQAAMKEGVVPGGGTTLMRAAASVPFPEGDFTPVRAGYQVVKTACLAPFRQIVANSGGTPEIVQNALNTMSSTHVYDAFRGTYGDMLELGIVDPARVVKCALKNAASAAGMMLTVGCALVEDDSSTAG
jgi:chaperonin GroEL